ncbi:MAG: hypothetical protein U0271_03070 [Polyangiaceae bacterium]
MRTRAAILLFLSACGTTSKSPEPARRDPVSSANQPEIDPQVCASDADCMVGTPRDCCASFCKEDAVAWSRAAWADYQAACAVEECAHLEEPACRPGPQPERSARCASERCVLTAVPSQ